MEDVLEIYKLPYDAERPVIRMDEMPKQLLAQTREPLPPQPGHPAHEYYECKRNGVADLFMIFEPLQGKRFVQVTAKRRRIELAIIMKHVADELYPHATKIVVVLDNLNTHTPAAFYETFAPIEARRLAESFEFHFKPKHGSWLNMAEIESSALVRECLNRRLPDLATIAHEVKTWQQQSNDEVVKAHWQFKTDEARVKLKHLYPKIEL